MMKRSKYGNVKTVVDGITFDSKKEAQYYSDLKWREKARQVEDIQLQPVFPVTINGVKVFTYKADFSFTQLTTPPREIVVDVKGMRTPIYRLKKKCVEAQYGIKIVEV